MRPGWFPITLFALPALLPLTGCGNAGDSSNLKLTPIVAVSIAERQRPVDRATLLSCWAFEQPATDGRIYYYTYTFQDNGNLVQTRMLGGDIQTVVAPYRFNDGVITITWPNNGGVEQGRLTVAEDGQATYRITMHSTDRSQVGHQIKMSRVLPDGTTAVVTLRNPTAAPLAVETRWARWDHTWTDWQTTQVAANESRDFWLTGAYHCQVRYNGTPNAARTEKLYEAPVNVVPRTDRPAAGAGRRFVFQDKGGVLELFSE